MAKIRALKKYDISKHRFAELYHFCLQYKDWKQQIENAPANGADGGRIRELEQKCRLIEETAKEVDDKLETYLIIGVTAGELSYKQLKDKTGIPCSKDQYYDRRQRFYWLLSQKLLDR